MASAAAAAPAELAEAERGMSAENGATGSTGPSRQNASDQPSIAPPYVNDLLSTVLHSTLRPASVNPKDYAWGNPGPAQQSRLFQQLAQMQQFYTVSSAAAGQLQMPSFGFPGFFPPFGLPTCFPAWGAQFPGAMRFSFGGGVGRSAFGASARPRAPVKGTVKGCKGSKTKATKKAKKVKVAARHRLSVAAGAGHGRKAAVLSAPGGSQGGDDTLLLLDEDPLLSDALQAVGEIDDMDLDVLMSSMGSVELNNAAAGGGLAEGGAGLQGRAQGPAHAEGNKDRGAPPPRAATAGMRKEKAAGRAGGSSLAPPAGANAAATALPISRSLVNLVGLLTDADTTALTTPAKATPGEPLLDWPSEMGGSLRALLDDFDAPPYEASQPIMLAA